MPRAKAIELTLSDSPSPPRKASSSKKRTLADTSNGGASGSSHSAPKKDKPTYESYHDVILPGESSGDVPVYDCCTTIRKKINAHLANGNTAAGFLREIGGINSNALARFRKESGPNGGAANQVYPAAYIYFEKHRIFDGKPKTASRLNSEAEFPGGRPLEQQRYGYFPTASGKMTRRKIK